MVCVCATNNMIDCFQSKVHFCVYVEEISRNGCENQSMIGSADAGGMLSAMESRKETGAGSGSLKVGSW